MPLLGEASLVAKRQPVQNQDLIRDDGFYFLLGKATLVVVAAPHEEKFRGRTRVQVLGSPSWADSTRCVFTYQLRVCSPSRQQVTKRFVGASP